MPFLFKLSQRVARIRSHTLLVALATTVFACERGDQALSGPDRINANTASGQPAGVSDLAVTAVTDTSTTLAFTEVDDGFGSPASYQLRYALGPIAWGSASIVARGTCATPLAGTTIGVRRSCTVLGLQASTAYQFELVPFRGTLDLNAAFGPVSSVASATTAAGKPGSVMDLAVSGASDTSVTLSYTEVTDGTRQPASYDIRYAAGTISWGGATEVTRVAARPGSPGARSARSGRARCSDSRRQRAISFSS